MTIRQLGGTLSAANPPVSDRIRAVLNGALYVLALVVPLIWVGENFAVYNAPGNLLDPFTDASTYLAAGERLNAGHALYALQPGDRWVLVLPGTFESPLLSPPPIAVLWRPLAAFGVGMQLWILAAWACLLGTIVFLLRRVGPWAALAVILLSHAIGEQLAVANANAFVPAMYILAWRYRTSWWSGFLLGTVASVKLAPIIAGGWLVGGRRWIAVVAMFFTLAAWFLIGGIGAGFNTYVEYLGTLGQVRPTPLTVSGLFGPVAGYAFLAAAFFAAVIAGATRHPRASFVIAILGSVLGTPALYASGLVGLLAVMAPWAFDGPHRHSLPDDERLSPSQAPLHVSREDPRPA